MGRGGGGENNKCSGRKGKVGGAAQPEKQGSKKKISIQKENSRRNMRIGRGGVWGKKGERQKNKEL